MFNKFAQKTILGSIAAGLLTACATPMHVEVDPPLGSPGDIVVVNFKGPAGRESRITIADQQALIIKSNADGVAVMVPPSTPRQTRVAVTSGRQKGSAPFEVLGTGTVRYWFRIEQSQVRFVSTQPGNEEFRQDKSYSPAKLQYELFDRNGEAAVIGFVPDPTDLELPAENQQTLSRVNLAENVMFSITVPPVPGVVRARLSLINASTQFAPQVLGELNLPELR